MSRGDVDADLDPAPPRRSRARVATPPRTALALALAAWVTVSVACTAAPEVQSIDAVRVIAEDDPRWARPDSDDRAWPMTPIHGVDPPTPVWWLRATVRLDDRTSDAASTRGLAVLALASCEVYWDGAFLGANGTVSERADGERPGRIAWLASVPPTTSGEHLISLRCSAHHRGFDPTTGFYGIWIGDHAALAVAPLAYAAPTLLSAGALLTIGVFYVMTFAFAPRRAGAAAGSRRAHLWLGGFALAAGLMVLAESARALVNYTYDHHLQRLVVITALAWAVNVALLGFLTRRFALPGRRVMLGIGVVLTTACTAAPGFDRKVGLVFLVGLTLSLGWALYAVVRRRWHAGFAAGGLIGCLAAAAAQPDRYLDFYLFFMLGVTCLGLLASHVLVEARERAHHEAIALRSARLEIELLRRQLQPHFLMNTLTALAEWFEEAPAVASAMVEDVGRELRLLSEVSRHTAVPMETELALCRSHLAVMARRRDERLELVADGVALDAAVPPALFHTLIENALTHNSYRGRGAVFRLRQEPAPAPFARRYTFDAPRAPRARASGPEPGGTGLRYIHARLREGYGDHYRLTSQACRLRSGDDDEVWRTVIDLGPPAVTA